MKYPYGSAMMKFCLSLLMLALGLGSFGANIPNPPPDAVKLMPVSGSVKAWEVYPETLVFGAGKGLTEIYNGGFELYTGNGVLDAAQQMYRSKDDIAIVTIHRMESPKAAAKFLEYWRKGDKKQPAYKHLKIADDAYLYTADGSANGCLVRDKYFVTVSVYIDEEKGRAVCESFLKEISAGIEKLVKLAKTQEQKPACRSGDKEQ